ncbi:hypothetical protein JG687_00001743 [Phytophthora cactorum]|uniref:Gem-associated protein 6 n=1 Tax=Phytophthora cactorum TaxID=29920 RepID=A0A8T1DGS6_9STRA|nr:hypothetical protein Pcac1_g22342 [Phytophthora cactorum]KAG2836618.1 hypothetical protein PC112_g5213 [Phytophthora cactorum]KAG2839422.1 hypothetical protein PC111_g3861 [Phytophthora cactorum]KAG2925571.1 hypothetical protein PC114_g4044 [Phytophthora cactorum]KAG2938969.1 hypothetical protein PC115_g3429 [Phytophthora cactorum]
MASESSLFDQFSALIGQPARVHLEDGTYMHGELYCIDPETDHVALLCPLGHEDSGYNVKIVLAHHGLEKGRNSSQEDSASIQRRREQLGQILTKNFVPSEVAADGSIRVFGGAATVRAPFRAVECANEQLLRRMQQLLGQFEQQA